MSDTVLTKLRVPETDPKLVFRPRLMRLLDEGLGRKVTLVSAPAGYGKTTSVAMTLQVLDQSELIGLLNEFHGRGLQLLSLDYVAGQ